jgi:hypothetical protein
MFEWIEQNQRKSLIFKLIKLSKIILQVVLF